MNWYYEGARKRYFLVIVAAFATAKLCSHVDLIDTGMVVENVKEEIRQEQERNEEPYTDNEGFHHNV